MNRIFLIGYMGAGKTTVGKCLAQQFGWQFIDTDKFIENRYRKKINEIFAEQGEAEFREIERKILLEVAAFDRVIVSTGGGTPCFFDNLDVMNRAGITIYLNVSAGVLAQRLEMCKATRPLIKDKNAEEIEVFVRENLSKREVFYRRAQIVFPVEALVSFGDTDRQVGKLITQLTEKK
ncbi:shikimate kinase [Bacteroidia bacterium]|nr:shikimate kinase [Bacteroidia bacterium]